MDAGLFVIRVVFGVLIAAHGAQKLFGWFGGPGLGGVAAMFETLGFRPGPFFAATAAASEFFGGTLFALGLFGPIGPALVVAVMTVAAIAVHLPNGLFAAANGIELPLLYAAAAVGVAFAGPGAFSFDARLGLPLVWTFGAVAFTLAIAVFGATAAL